MAVVRARLAAAPIVLARIADHPIPPSRP